jgi:Tol biopolymer transport system component
VKRLLVLAAALIAVPSATGTVGNGSILLLPNIAPPYLPYWDLSSVRPDGSQLTVLKTHIRAVAVSPDGREIAYVVANGVTVRDVYVMNADGSGARKVASATVRDAEAGIGDLTWFPDNVRLAYKVPIYSVQIFEFRIVDVQSGAQVPLPVYEDGVPQVVQPDQWSPDGTEFAY